MDLPNVQAKHQSVIQHIELLCYIVRSRKLYSRNALGFEIHYIEKTKMKCYDIVVTSLCKMSKQNERSQ